MLCDALCSVRQSATDHRVVSRDLFLALVSNPYRGWPVFNRRLARGHRRSGRDTYLTLLEHYAYAIMRR